MSKQVHEVRGQSIIRVSNQDEIPKVQEENSRKKIPTVQEAIKRSQAVVPKPFTLNLSHPSLWVHGACAGDMSSCGGLNMMMG